MYQQIQVTLNQLAAQHNQVQQALQQVISQTEQEISLKQHQVSTLRWLQQQESAEGMQLRSLANQAGVAAVASTSGNTISTQAFGTAGFGVNPYVTGSAQFIPSGPIS